MKQDSGNKYEVVKTWHPTDFGFFGTPDRPDIWVNGQYELRRFPEDMWLLRRKIRKDDRQQQAVKFYYLILNTDYEFANWLLNRRLHKI